MAYDGYHGRHGVLVQGLALPSGMLLLSSPRGAHDNDIGVLRTVVQTQYIDWALAHTDCRVVGDLLYPGHEFNWLWS